MASELPQNETSSQKNERVLIDAARREVEELQETISATVPQMPTQTAFPGYDLLRELRRGGQGIVYEAFQRSTNRKVAIKVLLDGSLASETARVRFNREIRVLASLRHPNIVVIHDSGVSGFHPYFVMDYVDGEHIQRYCCSHSFGIVETVRLFRPVVDAVAFAHRKGVVHRDLKPSNILVDHAGTPYVLDFGLAKMTENAKEDLSTTVSKTGQLIGTLRYMSPEQLAGDSGSVNARTDVHALGVILFELLTGSHPSSPSAETTDGIHLIAELSEFSRFSSNAGSELERIIDKAMSNDLGRRYPSAAEMMQDLDQWLIVFGPRPALHTAVPPPTGPRLHQKRYWLWGAASVALITATLSVGTLLQGKCSRSLFGCSTGQRDNSALLTGVSSMPALTNKEMDQNCITPLEYLQKNLPLKCLHIAPISGGQQVRITGSVLNEGELRVLENRIQAVKTQVQLEVRANPEALRLLVQRSLVDAGAHDAKVRIEGPSGHERLNAEITGKEKSSMTKAAQDYVFDTSLVLFRSY